MTHGCTGIVREELAHRKRQGLPTEFVRRCPPPLHAPRLRFIATGQGLDPDGETLWNAISTVSVPADLASDRWRYGRECGADVLRVVPVDGACPSDYGQLEFNAGCVHGGRA